LQLIPVPALPKKIAIDDIMKSVKKDKKTTSGVTRFVLLDGIGRAFSDKKITPEILQTTLSKFFHHQKLTKK
jgi:3-dehydroquinate synthetase